MNDEKRMAGSFEITDSMQIGNHEVVLGESTLSSGMRYMVGICDKNDLFMQYSEILTGNDYAEIAKIYGERILSQAQQVIEERDKNGIPISVINKEDCIPDSFDKSIVGKFVAINPDVLRNEYKRADCQLVYVTGGFGAQANARGQSVICKKVINGQIERFNRSDILGEVLPERLPNWAKNMITNTQFKPSSMIQDRSR